MTRAYVCIKYQSTSPLGFCHVCFLTIKYVSTVQYLSISFLYIRDLRLSHFSQSKKVAVELLCHATALIYTYHERKYHELLRIVTNSVGAQWLSGRVLDSRPNDRGFEPHRRHCLVVLEQDTFILA